MDVFTSKGIGREGDQLRALASYLDDLVTAGYDARRGLKDRWELNEKVYRNDPSIAGVRLFQNFHPRALPVMSPRINRIVNTTVSAFEGPGTWFQAVPDDGDLESSESLERAVQVCLERGGFVRTLRRSLTTTALCGVAVLRVRMSDEGVWIDAVHPNDFVVSPSYGLDLRDAHLVGHRFYVPRWKVVERAKNKTYPLIDEGYASKAAQTDPDNDPSGRDTAYDRSNAEQSTSDRGSELVELWECIVRLVVDGKAGMYRAVFNQQDKRVFSLDSYPYDRPWYFDVRFHDEEGKWWPSTSVAQNIVGLCLLKSDIINLMAAGSMASVSRPVFISGGALGRKIKPWSLNQFIETAYDVKVQALPFDFNPQSLPLILDYIDRAIEAQTGVSDNRLNAEASGSERVTAREIAAMEAAAQQNEGSYSEFLAVLLQDIAAFVQKLLALHPRKVQSAYQGSIPVAASLAAVRNVRWQATGHTAQNAPNIVLGKLEAMLGLSSNPASGYHYQRVEKAVVEQMGLPMNTQKLEKTPEELAEQARIAQEMAQADALAKAGRDSGAHGLVPKTA